MRPPRCQRLDGSIQHCRNVGVICFHFVYIADKGGLPVDLQSRWMGREHSRDTDAYRHATVDEKLEWVKDGIREGKLAGPKASMYFELPNATRDQHLGGQVQAIHFTPLGLCL